MSRCSLRATRSAWDSAQSTNAVTVAVPSGRTFIWNARGATLRRLRTAPTQFYDPVTLGEGQAIYIDSAMGHAYVTATGCHEAEVLGVMSSADDDQLMQSLLTLHEEQSQKASTASANDKAHDKAITTRKR